MKENEKILSTIFPLFIMPKKLNDDKAIKMVYVIKCTANFSLFKEHVLLDEFKKITSKS